ncbi:MULTISPECIES: efflux transporter outer membrane subunit [Mediterranea]|uniref:efflux transporter outer membrane subunit n=1 Tax=Mediterranea TaxID=1926659 RepID=UPI002013B608|nr:MULTISPECIES: efflux transporter outer membrane subunit [Mediterranea]MCL1608259.1 efflux transporter outer membrane subunit [Mediterranea sp. ET5]MDM8121521.1 efflux transporter outer membrane subunit [Mediterranea massiliensis]MDM8198545.1 efflux transporter outer membrane subunit [Mediterranea massiliensis]
MKRFMKHILTYILFLGVCLTSCQLGKHYTRPDLHLPERLDSMATDTMSIADFRWWEIYTDTTLQTLIRQTLEHNKDMLTAAARLKEMAAQKRIAYANLFPEVKGQLYTDKEAENYGGDSYESVPEYSAKFIASWELDLWGNLRWVKDRSMAQFLQAVENQRALRMTLVAQVAQAYFELVALDNELAIVKQTLRARQESVHLAELRFNGGLTSETAYQQAQVELARTATLVPDLERAIALKENDISFLAGRYPSTVERSHHPQDIRLPETLPAGLPSSLLERRPDVRAAEEALIAANAEVGIAYTNLFPRITLTAHYGLESEEFRDFLHSPYHFLSANLLTPLFAMGKNRAALKAKKAACEQAAYQYEKAVLSAFKDARNAIVEFNKIQDIYDAQLELEQAARKSIDLTRTQYLNGYISYLDMLDAQRTYLDAQIALSNAVRDKQIALVQLYKALGGGWE